MKTFLEYKTIIFRILFLLWGLWLLKHFCMCVYHYDEYIYRSWEISDWMINYEGGFVRRGLCGEILYLFYSWHPYPMRDVILIINITVFVIFLWLVIRLFLKEGWSFVILFSTFFLGPVLLDCFWIRRDYLALLVTWGIFYFYYRYTHQRNWLFLFLMQVLSIFTLLLHEASFFFTFPVLFVHFYFKAYQKSYSVRKSLCIAILLLVPALLVMCLVCVCKGDQFIANAIWTSWKPCMESFPLGDDVTEIGEGVKALVWDTTETFKKHMEINYLNHFYKSIPSFPVTILNFAFIYYLLTRMNTVNLRWNVLRAFDRIQLSNILLLQFVFMLPLFTVLSCDFGRTIPYWTFSTLFAFHFFKDDKRIFPKFLSRFSQLIQDSLDQLKWLVNPWIYTFILFSLPISEIGGATIYTSNLVKMFFKLWSCINPL